MLVKLKWLISGLMISSLAGVGHSGTIKVIQLFNNLYSQASSDTTVTASSITVQYYNEETLCDTATLSFRNYATENAGTGSNQPCANITSLQFIAGSAMSNTSIQIYNPLPVVVNLNDANYAHSVIIQDLGTGLPGAPAIDGSIKPTFNVIDGTVSQMGTMGTVLVEH